MASSRNWAARMASGLLAAALVAASAGFGAAQERSMEIAGFHADLVVEPDGNLRVLESITVDFRGRWNGIFRTIPVEYRDDRGLRSRLRIQVRSVTGDSGQDLWYEESREGIYRKLKIAVPGAENATRTVHIRYDVPNGLRFFEEHDELYWNVTGTEWPFPIRRASAQVTLPDGTSGLRATAFVGGYGSSESGAYQGTDSGFYFESPRPLGIREGLTIAVAWEPGVVARPSGASRAWWLLRSNWLFIFPFLTFFGMHRIWRARGKDPERRAIVPQYVPPEGLTPAEAGTLIDSSPDMRDLTASIVDLAVRGYLRIEETQTEKLLGLIKKTDYRFVRTRDVATWNDLHAHERLLLRALFSEAEPDGSVLMSDLEHEFYRDLPDIKKGLWDRLLSLKLYDRRPDHVMAAWIVGGLVFGFLTLMVFLFIGRALFLAPGWTVLAAALTALPVIGFGIVMPARTVHGARPPAPSTPAPGRERGR